MIEFSIIIPLYNKELSIKNTIDSVLSQSYPNFELIIVNDGSTDTSLEIAKSFKDNRIRIIDISNGGVSNARNTGIKAARYEYITFLDADDLWYENSLAEFKYLIENFKDAQVYCTSHTLTVKEIESRKKRYYIDNFWRQNAISFARNTTAVVCTGCIAIKKECFDIISGFNITLIHGEDLDLWNRLAEKFTFAKSELITMLYRLDAENRSDTTKLKKNINFVKRNEVIGKYKALDYGRIYFFELYYNLKQFKNFSTCFRLITNYSDWMLLFLFTVLYVRILNK
jgi:glycosyltransferase involved in cell wall biosynthesis